MDFPKPDNVNAVAIPARPMEGFDHTDMPTSPAEFAGAAAVLKWFREGATGERPRVKMDELKRMENLLLMMKFQFEGAAQAAADFERKQSKLGDGNGNVL